MGVGIVVVAQLNIGAGEIAVGAGLRGRIGQPSGGGHGGVLGGGEIVPVPSPVEEAEEGPGQLPGVGVVPGGGGVVDGGEQDGVFGGEPFQGLLMVGGVFGGGAGLGRGEGDRVSDGVEEPVGGVGGV